MQPVREFPPTLRPAGPDNFGGACGMGIVELGIACPEQKDNAIIIHLNRKGY